MAFIFNPFNPVNPFFYFTHRAEAINPLGRRPSTKTQTKKKEEKKYRNLVPLKAFCYSRRMIHLTQPVPSSPQLGSLGPRQYRLSIATTLV